MINNNFVFIDSMQFMNSCFDALIRNLSNNDVKYLSAEFSGDFLKLVKQKRAYRYECMASLKGFLKINYPTGVNFFVL